MSLLDDALEYKTWKQIDVSKIIVPRCTICGDTQNLVPMGTTDSARWCTSCHRAMSMTFRQQIHLPIQHYVVENGRTRFVGFVSLNEHDTTNSSTVKKEVSEDMETKVQITGKTQKKLVKRGTKKRCMGVSK